jgi:hypothetical protein
VRLRRTVVFFVLALVLIAAGNAVRAQFESPAPGSGAGWPFLGHWMLLQYLVDYADLGFVRRGLVGTLLPFDPALGATPALLAAATAPAVCLAGVIAPLLARLQDQGLALAFAVSPALFWQMGYDLGRFDILNLLLALVIALSPWRWALMAAPVTLFIHEAAAAIVMPVLFALHWQRFGLGAPLVAAGVAALVTTAALVELSARPGEATVLAAYPIAEPDSARVFARSVADNLALAWRHVTEQRSARQFWMLVPPALYVAALLVVVARMLRGARRAWVPLTAALSPLVLPLVGADYARWIALAGANIIVVALLLGRERSARLPRTALAVLVAAGALGPIGIIFGFPAPQFLWWG